MKRYKLPFSGFYGTMHEQTLDDALEQVCTDNNGDVNESELDALIGSTCWSHLFEKYSRMFVDRTNDLVDGVEITYLEVESPREYNFANDSILVTITDEHLKIVIGKVLANHYDALAALILKRCTSYDGFISFYSNNLEQWKEDCDYDLLKLDEPQIDLILECYLVNENDFDENEVMEDWNCNGEFYHWLDSQPKEQLA